MSETVVIWRRPIVEKPKLVTAERLRELLSYDPETGEWTWLVDRGTNGLANAGDRAGHIDANGYRIIKIDNDPYRASRLAFLYVLGHWPEDDADHKNRIRSDDRWCNLRPATPSQNKQNSPPITRLSDLPRGVYNNRNRFMAKINKTYLGNFATPEEASAVYEATAKELFGEFYCAPSLEEDAA